MEAKKMTEKPPTSDEMRVFLQKQIAEKRKHGTPDEVDHLLDQLIDLDIAHKFVEQVINE
jgi:hypothetical protein